MFSYSNQVVVSCEHGGYEIPSRLRERFAPHQDLLISHYGWDPGALEMARHLQASFQAPLVSQTVSRLVVECNRTLMHPQLWSRVTNSLAEADKTHWLDTVYHPYRDALHAALRRKMENALPALHISSHTMAAEVNGERRWMDVALLFDPARSHELAFCEAWKAAMERRNPRLKVAFNEPFQGYNDGQVVWLRRQYGQDQYWGIELELNQGYVDSPEWQPLRQVVVEALQETTATYPTP